MTPNSRKTPKRPKEDGVIRRGGRVTMEFKDRGVVISGGRRGVEIISKIFKKRKKGRYAP